MRTWLFIFGGLLVWAAHFFGVYGLASLADVIENADIAWSRWATAGWTLLCAAADGALLRAATRRTACDELQRFTRSVAVGGALISLAAVLWQGLPALVGH